GEYLLGGATSSSFPCSGQPYWVPVRKLRGPSLSLRPARLHEQASGRSTAHHETEQAASREGNTLATAFCRMLSTS
ncbi:hypothetical protein ACIRP7_45540, partial [Streptomyces sp. NPDC102270]